jgi:tripartite-type tricarboxylate transporter receptor subunit TctC
MRPRQLFTALPLALLACAAHAVFPDKPVKLIVPFSAGAAADAVARPLAAQLSKTWGQQVLVDNRPGPAAGPQAVLSAPADGYTLLFGAGSTMVTAPIVISKLPYRPQQDFVPISRLVTLPPVLVANASLGIKSLKELVDTIKAKPNAFNYMSSGIGAPNHLGMEYLLSLTGGDMVHVPYKGAAPALVDLVSNHVQVGFATLPSVLPHLKNGKLVALAVGSPQRTSLLPDVPAVAETLPSFDYTAFYGLFAPKGTSPALVEKIRVDVAQALAQPEIQRAIRAEGAEPAPTTGAELAKHIEEETALWHRIIKQRNLKFD